MALVSLAESLDTGSAAGRLVLNIMAAVSQWEREAIGERTRDPAERAALAEIRRLRGEGTTLRGIAATANSRGHPYTPRYPSGGWNQSPE